MHDCRAVRMLCEADADVNVRDLIGRSPLWLAVCKDGHVNQVKVLLRDKTCELNYADMREKRTALQVRSHSSVCKCNKIILFVIVIVN